MGEESTLGWNSSFKDISFVWVPNSRHQQPWQTDFLALAHLWDLDSSSTAPPSNRSFRDFIQIRKTSWDHILVIDGTGQEYCYYPAKTTLARNIKKPGRELSFQHGLIHQANFSKDSSSAMLFATKSFLPKHKSFPLNLGGGRKSKDIKTMGSGGGGFVWGFFCCLFEAFLVGWLVGWVFTCYRTKFFGQGSNPSLCLVIMSVWDPDSGVSDCPEPSPELHGECFCSSEMQIWPLCLELTALLREAVKCEAVQTKNWMICW